MTTTRQAWITDRDHIKVTESELAPLQPHELLIRSGNAGVCGSDLHTWQAGHTWLPFPIPPGHEATGWVEEVGAAVDGYCAGDAVVLRPIINCGTCFTCQRGLTNLCENLSAIGAHRPGAMADRFVAPMSSVSPLPPGVSMAAGAMIEPLSCVAHAARLVGVEDRTVVVVGAGSMGLLAMLNALSAGASRVVVTDMIAAKREVAESLGAYAAFDAANSSVDASIRSALGGRPDVVLDCVGSAASVKFAAEQADPGGKVAVIGVCDGSVTLPLNLVQDREVTLAGSSMYVAQDFDRALDLVAGGLPVERLVTSEFDLDDVQAAFAAAASGEEIKVHVVANRGVEAARSD